MGGRGDGGIQVPIRVDKTCDTGMQCICARPERTQKRTELDFIAAAKVKSHEIWFSAVTATLLCLFLEFVP
jgi:hypothetical protein